MSTKVLRSAPLRVVVPGMVLLVFGLLAVLLVAFEERQWGDYYEHTTLTQMRADLWRLQDDINDALASADVRRVEHEIGSQGFNLNLQAVAAVDDGGKVIYATRPEWRDAVARQMLPGYDVASAARAVARNEPLIEFSANRDFVSAYYPLNPASGEHRQQGGRGMLYARIDLRPGHKAVRYVALKASALLLGATALAMLLLFLVLRHFVVRPMTLMADAAGAIVRGQATPFTIRGSGKIAQLGHAFNEAAITARQLLTELRESEQRYRTIVEHVGLGVMLIDRELRLLEINGTLRGWFPNADHVEYCYELFPDNDSGRCPVCSAHFSFSSGEVVETVTDVPIGDTMRTLRIVMTPVRDERGEVTACVEIMEDITERETTRRQLEQVTRAQRALSVCSGAVVRARTGQELLQQVCDVIVAVGGYRMCWIGRATDTEERQVLPVAMAGGAKGYLAGIKVSWGENDLGHGPTGTAIREGRPVAYQNLLTAPNYQPWRDSALGYGFRAAAALPLFLDGRSYGALTIYAADADAFVPEELALLIELADTTMHGVQSLYDQQARRVSERELTRVNAELEQRVERRTAELNRINKELEAFTYSVSHDLRAPLRAIDGFSQILVQKYAAALDEQATDYLQRVRKATQRMGRLIDDLLGLSRINRHELHIEPVDVSEMAQEVCKELQDAEPERSVEVRIAPGLVATSDARLVRIILANLLGNAWKYTGKVPDARIELAAWQNESGGQGFVVHDNGVGFDMKYAGKLFAPFQRLHGPSEFEGTGIGLATVQRATDRLGGHVMAEASPGVGAAFYFCFNCDAPAGDTQKEMR